MGGGIPLWVWIAGGIGLVGLVLFVIAVKGYPEDGAF
jgi:hypothetical protein